MRGDRGLEIPGNDQPLFSTDSADIAVAISNEPEDDDDSCTITDDITSTTYTRTATEGCATTITAPVTITETVNDKTYTRTVTNGDQTSFTVPCSTYSACPAPTPCNTGSARPSPTTVSTTTTTSATPTSTALIDCQVNLQIGLFYNFWYGSVDANAVNIFQTVHKSYRFGHVFKAQPGEKFTAAPNLDNPTNSEWSSFGSRQDGIFMMAAAQGNGSAYYFPANSTAPLLLLYTRICRATLSGSAKNEDTCFTDLAFDSNGYLWVITAYWGGLFISTTLQTTTLGGKMKYIGELQVDGEPIASPKVSVGIAFDASGNVYYSGSYDKGLSPGGWVSKASILNPLVSTTVYSGATYVIDLGTCAYPTIDISSLLA